MIFEMEANVIQMKDLVITFLLFHFAICQNDVDTIDEEQLDSPDRPT